MKSLECRRLWQVEAARDGRLSDRDAASFEVHARTCVACSGERQQLEALRQRLRELEPPADEVSLYRGRQKLLESLDSQATRARRPAWQTWQTWQTRQTASRWTAVAVCAALGLVALATMTGWPMKLFSGARVSLSVEVAVLGTGANWTRSHARGLERIALHGNGVFNIHIKRSPGDPRVIVEMPDGEVEDIGTAFQVSIYDEHTFEIAVSEGAVLLHRRGNAPVRIAAGEVWRPAPEAPAQLATSAVSATSATSATTIPAVEPRGAATPAAPSPGREGLPVGATAREAPSPREHGPSARRAVVSSRAPELGARDEDASYLRIIALLRDGREFEAQLAAVEYLSRFPAGFRRAEMARIAARR